MSLHGIAKTRPRASLFAGAALAPRAARGRTQATPQAARGRTRGRSEPDAGHDLQRASADAYGAGPQYACPKRATLDSP